MSPDVFNKEAEPGSWPLFTSVDAVRAGFRNGTAVMVAIGGWGAHGFSAAAATERSREGFARNVGRMVRDTGADGVDIDWEYPGGNGEDYKKTPNSERAWEITAYPLLLTKIRSELGDDKLISAAVPGRTRDMLAFTATTIPAINAAVDFLNIMTYDLMNRRDSITIHHTGIELSLTGLNAYEERGVPAAKMNLGFAFYIKWYRTDPRGGCDREPVGCRTVVMEDPVTGDDLGQAGAFSWHDAVPEELVTSYRKAMAYGEYDSVQGGHYYWDSAENLWWSWDTPDAIARKFPTIMEKKNLGGVFAWGLGEDANDFRELEALTAGVKKHFGGRRDAEKSVRYTSQTTRIQDEL